MENVQYPYRSGRSIINSVAASSQNYLDEDFDASSLDSSRRQQLEDLLIEYSNIGSMPYRAEAENYSGIGNSRRNVPIPLMANIIRPAHFSPEDFALRKPILQALAASAFALEGLLARSAASGVTKYKAEFCECGGLIPVQENNAPKAFGHTFIATDKLTDEICSICLQNFEINEVLRQLRCRHILHQLCCDNWLAIQKSCPLCRSPLKSCDFCEIMDGDAGFDADATLDLLRIISELQIDMQFDEDDLFNDEFLAIGCW